MSIVVKFFEFDNRKNKIFISKIKSEYYFGDQVSSGISIIYVNWLCDTKQNMQLFSILKHKRPIELLGNEDLHLLV